MLLAARQLVDPARPEPLDLGRRQRAGDARGDLGLRKALFAQAEGHVVGDAQVRPQREALEHHRGLARVRGGTRHILVAEVDRAGARLDKTRDRAQDGGLSAAARAEQQQQLLGPDREADPIDRDLGPKPDHQISDRHARHRPAIITDLMQSVDSMRATMRTSVS